METETYNTEEKENEGSMLELVNKDLHREILNIKNQVELRRNLK